MVLSESIARRIRVEAEKLARALRSIFWIS